jgi:rhodanese-related sulfurtransferase
VDELQRISPEQVGPLLDQGYVYLDVRSEPEFEQGHVPGALNVPLMHQAAGGMTANAEFMQVVEGSFAKHEKLIVGCKSGARSQRAARMMLEAGFRRLCELETGFDGSRDAFGRVKPGYARLGLPIETGKPSGQAYQDVKQRRSPG